MTDGVVFDNILITDDVSVADKWTSQTWHIKKNAEFAFSAKNSYVTDHSFLHCARSCLLCVLKCFSLHVYLKPVIRV